MSPSLCDEPDPDTLLGVVSDGLTAIQTACRKLQGEVLKQSTKNPALSAALKALLAEVFNMHTDLLDTLESFQSSDITSQLDAIAKLLRRCLAGANELASAGGEINSFPLIPLDAPEDRFSEILRSPETCEKLKEDLQIARTSLPRVPINTPDKVAKEKPTANVQENLTADARESSAANVQKSSPAAVPYDSDFHPVAAQLFDDISHGCISGQKLCLRLGDIPTVPPSDDDDDHRALDILFWQRRRNAQGWLAVRLHSNTSNTPTSNTSKHLFNKLKSFVQKHLPSASDDDHVRGHSRWRREHARAYEYRNGLQVLFESLNQGYEEFLHHIEHDGSKLWLYHNTEALPESDYYRTERSLGQLSCTMNWSDLEKVAISLRLAHAFSYYYGSGWLAGHGPLTADNIYFFRQRDGTPCQPWLGIVNSETPSERYKVSKEVLHPQLLELGVLLLEIELGMSVEQFSKKPRTDDVQRRAVYASIIWHRNFKSGVSRVAVEDYRKAITFCLKCDHDEDPAKLRKQIYETVVCPLQSFLSQKNEVSNLELVPKPSSEYRRSLERPGTLRSNHMNLDRPDTAEASRMSWERPDNRNPTLDFDAMRLTDDRSQLAYRTPVIADDTFTNQFKLSTANERLEQERRQASHYTTRSCFANGNTYARAVDAWISRLKTLIEGKQRSIASDTQIKVGLLDTGIDLTHEHFYDDEFGKCRTLRIKEICSFVDGARGVQTPKGGDEHGHGTFIASLILDLCPNIDLYVARVSKSETWGDEVASNVAHALRHAIEEWDVDMISMSFGFDGATKDIQEQLDRVCRNKHPEKNILVFAAAANDGLDGERAYPASHSSVFAIHSFKIGGTKSTFNPSPRYDRNFGTLGEEIQSAWLTRDGGGSACLRRQSGTSFATPIVVCLAAFLMTYVPVIVPDHDELLYKIRTFEGMERLLQKLVVTGGDDKTSRYQYLSLEWFLNSAEGSSEAIAGTFRNALSQ